MNKLLFFLSLLVLALCSKKSFKRLGHIAEIKEQIFDCITKSAEAGEKLKAYVAGLIDSTQRISIKRDDLSEADRKVIRDCRRSSLDGKNNFRPFNGPNNSLISHRWAERFEKKKKEENKN